MPESGSINPDERVQWVYSSTTNDELAERYDQWAREYDDDLENTFVWLAPLRGAETLAEHVAKDARILDAGAGTGLVGVELQRLGYGDICAMDLSEGMLDEARSKGCYNDFRQMALGDHLDFDSDAYDAVISIGVFTPGPCPAQFLRGTLPCHQARRSHRVQHAPRHPCRVGLQGSAGRAGRQRSLVPGRRHRAVPASAQGRAGSDAPDLGLPSELSQTASVARKNFRRGGRRSLLFSVWWSHALRGDANLGLTRCSCRDILAPQSRIGFWRELGYARLRGRP